ncbi:MAG: RNA polymerase sigma factor [Ktedonobacterales bacterium]
MNPRNFLRRHPLEPDMTDEWTLGSLSQLGRSAGAAVPGLDIAANAPATIVTEEAALVALARAGDQDAFGTLVRLHQRQVYNLALRMLHDPEEASEAAQEVFLAAWQGLRAFRGDARFATWLYRIAYNYCLKLVEHRRRDAVAQAELAAESAREQSPAGAMSTHHAQDAERAMREQVRGEIANLPPKYRVVLVLRHLQELSYEEMAEVMRVPIGTVKTQLFRARALLKERLEEIGRVRAVGLGSGLRGALEHGKESAGRGDAL